MSYRTLAGLAALVLLAPLPANAQGRGWEGRARVAVNGGYQTTSNDFSQTLTFPFPDLGNENGTVATDYPAGQDVAFDGGVAVRIWRNLGVGGAVSVFRTKEPGAVVGRIPHPFFFDRLREVTGQSADLERTETAFHLHAVLLFPLAERVDLTVSGGPSFFNVEQDMVTGVQFSHSFPFDTARFTGAQAAGQSESAIGFNAGFDLTWRFATHVGVGGQLRFSRAEVELTPLADNAIKVDAGGLQVGAGVRFVF
jgi:hypothetical protein